ncbi:hypothetical protein [Paraburkholderia xenovorans]
MNALEGDDFWDVQWVPRLHLVGAPGGVMAHMETGSYQVMVVQAGNRYWLVAGSSVLCRANGTLGDFLWVHPRELRSDAFENDAYVVEFDSIAEVRSFVLGMRASAQGIALSR